MTLTEKNAFRSTGLNRFSNAAGVERDARTAPTIIFGTAATTEAAQYRCFVFHCSRNPYVGTTQFWFESLQNWQSEFFSIGMMVVLSIVLRQRRSPESKPVDSPHRQTGQE
jgi:hypothetical protein